FMPARSLSGSDNSSSHKDLRLLPIVINVHSLSRLIGSKRVLLVDPNKGFRHFKLSASQIVDLMGACGMVTAARQLLHTQFTPRDHRCIHAESLYDCRHL
ncbi:MAG TPA: hypothetical protein VJ809_03935, partial [Pirellulales bacterium]|nr:hypothetical protein [Pirellulales bacterium]